MPVYYSSHAHSICWSSVPFDSVFVNHSLAFSITPSADEQREEWRRSDLAHGEATLLLEREPVVEGEEDSEEEDEDEDDEEKEGKMDEGEDENKKRKDKKAPRFLKAGTLIVLPTVAITQWAAEIARCVRFSPLFFCQLLFFLHSSSDFFFLL